MEWLHMNWMDTRWRNLGPRRKRVGGRENKGNLEMDETNTVEKNWYLILRLLKWSASLEERQTGWTRLAWHSRLSRRISIRTGVWEHHLGKVWNQHLTSKQLEYHNSKQNKRIGLQNKPEQTYDRDFARSFRGGAYTGSIVQHHHVQGSAHDIRSVPESA